MPDSCDYKLASGFGANCANPVVSGMESRGIIINREDIDFDSCTMVTGKKNVVKTLVLKSGKVAYEMYVPGASPYTGTVKNMVEGTYRKKFNKNVNIVILDNGAAVCADVIDQLANGKFVLLMENTFRGTDNDNRFELYGWETGCVATALDDDKYSEDTEGGWACTMQEANAPSSGIFFWNTDASTTEAAIESLLGNGGDDDSD